MASGKSPAVEIPRSPGLVREGLWVSALTVASKLLGIVREGLMAWAFGTSGLVDAFRVAQSGTFLLTHLFGGSVLDSAFLPTFKHLLSSGRRRLAWRTAQQTQRALLVVGGVFLLALLFAGGFWTRVMAPGFDSYRTHLTAIFFAAMALTVPLALVANLLLTISNALYRFRVPALRALVQNLAILIGIGIALMMGARSRPGAAVMPLGFSLPLAQAVMIVLLFLALRNVARPRARGTPDRDRLIWRFFGLALIPGLSLVFLEQANLIVERMVASRLSEGSIASLDYARFLVETPLVTIGVGITQTLLPTLSDLSAAGDRVRFGNSVRTLLLACLWALLPLSVWLLSFGEELIRVIYARGAFDEASVRTTSAALAGFAIGLWAWFGGTVLQRAYYAQRRLRILLPLTAVGLVSFAVLSFLWAPRMGVRGVSTAFSVANVLFFSGSLAFLGWGLARTILPVLGYLLAGGALFYLVGPGIVPHGSPLARLAIGAVLILLAWVGWTAMNPATRRLALGLIRNSPEKVMGGGTREYQDDKWAARGGVDMAQPEPGSRAATALEQIPRDGLLVDLGCGDGALLRLAPSRKIGLDISVNGLGRVPIAIPRVCADLDSSRLPFRDACADAVTILDALPYVESPLRLFREIARILKPGGLLIASAPNGRQLPRLLGLFAGRPIALSSEEVPYDGGQRHIFTDRSMSLLMEATGFDCARVIGLLPVRPGSRLRAVLRPLARAGLGRAFLAPGFLVVGRRR